jgi:hypothetical protein
VSVPPDSDAPEIDELDVRERHIQFDLQDLQDISVFEAELCPAVWTTVLGRDGGTAHQGGACSLCRFAPEPRQQRFHRASWHVTFGLYSVDRELPL